VKASIAIVLQRDSSNAKYGVKEYWLVLLDTRAIEIQVLEEGILKPQRTFEERDELFSALLPGLSCKVASIFHT